MRLSEEVLALGQRLAAKAAAAAARERLACIRARDAEGLDVTVELEGRAASAKGGAFLHDDVLYIEEDDAAIETLAAHLGLEALARLA